MLGLALAPRLVEDGEVAVEDVEEPLDYLLVRAGRMEVCHAKIGES